RSTPSRARTPAAGERVETGAARPLPGADGTGGLLRRRRLALVLALEALHTAGRVHELLLPRVEGMALGADLHPDVGLGRPGVDDIPTRAGNGRLRMVRMNAHLHGSLLLRAPNIT